MAERQSGDIDQCAFLFKVSDAEGDDTAEITVNPDLHGCSIDLEGAACSLVLDFAGGQLRVFLTDEFGDVVDQEPLATLSQTSVPTRARQLKAFSG